MYTRKLRNRTIDAAKEEIVKGVTSVVEHALKIHPSPTPNSSDDIRQGQSTSCELTTCLFVVVLFDSLASVRKYFVSQALARHRVQ